MVVPHLILTGGIEVMKTSLYYNHPVVALACKRCSRQYLDHGEYANQMRTTYLCDGCSQKWDVARQVQDNPLAALSCQLRDGELYMQKVPICGTKGEYLVATAPALNMRYFASLLQLFGTLVSLVVEPTYLSHVSAASIDSKEVATIVHRARGDHPMFLQPSAMGLIFSSTGQILGICWWSQNCVGRFCWSSLFFFACQPLWCQKGLLFDIWACLVAHYIGVLQTGCVSLCYLLRE